MAPFARSKAAANASSETEPLLTGYLRKCSTHPATNGVVTPRWSTLKRRWIVLEDKKISWAKTPTASALGALPLNSETMVEKVTGVSQSHVIALVSDGTALVLKADTADMCTQWYEHISRAVSELRAAEADEAREQAGAEAKPEEAGEAAESVRLSTRSRTSTIAFDLDEPTWGAGTDNQLSESQEESGRWSRPEDTTASEEPVALDLPPTSLPPVNGPLTDDVPCFCFGSNSVTQLRERVKNDALFAEAASLRGYRRIFAGSSTKWGGGAVASIVRTENSTDVCRGAIVRLTSEEFDRLDVFEGVAAGRYRREWVEAEAAGGDTKTMAIAYIRNSSAWEAYPSQAYLTACYRTLSPHWPELDGDGAIIVLDEDLEQVGEWRPPLSPAKPAGEIKPSRTVAARGSASYLTRLTKKGAYKTPVAKAAAAVAGPELTPVWCTACVYEVSEVDAVNSRFTARVRMYLFWDLDQDTIAAHPELTRLVEEALEEGEHVKLSPEQTEMVAGAVLLPDVACYNLIESEVVDPPAMRLYSRGPGKPAALLWNAMYMWTCKEILEVNEFPVDTQDLTFDLRFVDTRMHAKYDLYVHAVQFERGALETVEWRLCEPIVERKGPKATVIRLQAKRNATYYYVNIVGVIAGVSLVSALAFACGIEDNGDRLGVTLTLLLTSVAFKLLLAEMVPKVPYITRLDKLLLMSVVLLFLTSVGSLVPSWVLHFYPDDPGSGWNSASAWNLWLGVACAGVSLLGCVVWMLLAMREDRRMQTPVIQEVPGQTWYYFSFFEPPFLSNEEELAPPPKPKGKASPKTSDRVTTDTKLMTNKI